MGTGCFRCGNLQHKSNSDKCTYAGQTFNGKRCTHCGQGSHTAQKGTDCRNTKASVRKENSDYLKKNPMSQIRPPFRRRSMSRDRVNGGKTRSQTPGNRYRGTQG